MYPLLLLVGSGGLALLVGLGMLLLRERSTRQAQLRRVEEALALQYGRSRRLAGQLTRLQALLVEKEVLAPEELQENRAGPPQEQSAVRGLH